MANSPRIFKGMIFVFCNMIKKYPPTYTHLLFNLYIFKGMFFCFFGIHDGAVCVPDEIQSIVIINLFLLLFLQEDSI